MLPWAAEEEGTVLSSPGAELSLAHLPPSVATVYCSEKVAVGEYRTKSDGLPAGEKPS